MFSALLPSLGKVRSQRGSTHCFKKDASFAGVLDLVNLIAFFPVLLCDAVSGFSKAGDDNVSRFGSAVHSVSSTCFPTTVVNNFVSTTE